MSTKVKVTAKEGQVVIMNENKPEYGYVRVESSTPKFENGFMTIEKRSALIRGKMDILKAGNFQNGQTLPGKIYHIESTTAPFEGAAAKINPSTSEEVLHGGLPIYRQSFYTTDLSMEDTLLENDKVAATVAAEAGDSL